MPDDSLDRWIDALRARLAAGDLADLGPIDLGYGTRGLRGDLTIRIMLHDLDDLDDPEGSWGGDVGRRAERRSSLLDDFRRLHATIG